jgi:tRNA threonylcarbamoyladenosine biosynthesis protein TsaE
VKLITHSPEETYRLGQRLGGMLQPPQIIALHGDLGAGKTALIQGIAAGLGITARVTSPTFILVNRYPTPSGGELIHIDCYRLGETRTDPTLEAATFGLDEILTDEQAITVIEWAERVADLLPVDYLQITLTHDPQAEQGRAILVTAHGAQSTQLLQTLVNGAIQALP